VDWFRFLRKAFAFFLLTLDNRPWELCKCDICKKNGIDVVIFRGANRNKRRGFHNTWVFRNTIFQNCGKQQVQLPKKAAVIKSKVH
jgi:hypothetical protein